SDGEKGYQRDRQDAPNAHRSYERAVTECRKRFSNLPAMPPRDESFFQDVEQDEHNRESRRFVDDWKDQWPRLESVSKLQILGNHHNLCEDRGIQEGEAVSQVAQVSQDYRLIEREQSKDDPQINKDDDKALEFINALGLQILHAPVRRSHLSKSPLVPAIS